ncbi:MAG TPA: PEGA domain-containing protein [Phycisphaerae bacterium]|nr:PEGA domain-containing protein [Phycisphaerae bacterium]
MTARRASVGILAAAVLAGGLTGCVRRTVTIRTDPQGATVHLNDQTIGTTPVSTDFTWYGDYDVVIRKEGYQTLSTHERIDAPWYELPGLDFISEVLVPWTIHDQRELTYTLEPAKPVDAEQLLEEAKQMRDRTLYSED